MHFDSSPASLSMKRRHTERGEGRLKTVSIIAVFLIAIYLGVKLVPPYVSEYQLADKMQEQARFGVVNRYTEDQVRESIYKVVQDLEIPVKREEIKVTVTPAIVKISVDYTVPVDLLVFSTELHFSPSSANKSLLSD